ncbi:hypothetical protein C8Q73DRAFT_680111 [Cubamyces lactineus]|nr:hypothetical protein C8Q73DRAFT_680111 [Cubamyces lactineus]
MSRLVVVAMCSLCRMWLVLSMWSRCSPRFVALVACCCAVAVAALLGTVCPRATTGSPSFRSADILPNEGAHLVDFIFSAILVSVGNARACRCRVPILR